MALRRKSKGDLYMTCSICGTKMLGKGMFCVRCGHSEKKAQEAAPARRPARRPSRKPLGEWLFILPAAAAIVFLVGAFLYFVMPGRSPSDGNQMAVVENPLQDFGIDSDGASMDTAYDSPFTSGMFEREPGMFDISVSANDYIEFGGQRWRVLAVEGFMALVIAERAVLNRNFHYSQVAVTWESSEIRRFLNDEFLSSFGPEDQALIAETTVINDGNPWFGTSGGPNTTDRIFLLSIDEVLRFFGDSGLAEKGANANERGVGFASQVYGIHGWGIHDQFSEARSLRDSGGSDVWWWLRSPGRESHLVAIVEGGSGSLNMYGSDVSRLDENGGGIRPAMWLLAHDLQKAEPPPAEQTVPVQAAAPDRRDDLLGVWRGTYYSGNGIMGREMAVYKDGDTYVAKVWFFPTVGSLPGRPSGEVLSDVFFDAGTNRFVITNSTWVVQPPGMGLFNRGDLALNGDVLAGVHDNRDDRPVNMTRAAYSNFTLSFPHSHIPGGNYRTIIEASGARQGLRVYFCVFCHVETQLEVFP